VSYGALKLNYATLELSFATPELSHATPELSYPTSELNHPTPELSYPTSERNYATSLSYATPHPILVIVIPFFAYNRDADRVTEWNTTLIEGRTLKRLSKDFIISYQVRKDSIFLMTFSTAEIKQKCFGCGEHSRRHATALLVYICTFVHINTKKFITALNGLCHELKCF
jgi:hypothetical protein